MCAFNRSIWLTYRSCWIGSTYVQAVQAVDVLKSKWFVLEVDVTLLFYLLLCRYFFQAESGFILPFETIGPFILLHSVILFHTIITILVDLFITVRFSINKLFNFHLTRFSVVFFTDADSATCWFVVQYVRYDRPNCQGRIHHWWCIPHQPCQRIYLWSARHEREYNRNRGNRPLESDLERWGWHWNSTCGHFPGNTHEHSDRKNKVRHQARNGRWQKWRLGEEGKRRREDWGEGIENVVEV